LISVVFKAYALFCSQVRGDFVLVSGDTVSNMSLTEVVKEHQERRKKDKLAVMTMVVKRAKPSPSTYQTRLGNDELLLAIDPQSKQLLHYDTGRESGGRDIYQHQSSQRHVKLERSALNDRPSVQLCTNLQVSFPLGCGELLDCAFPVFICFLASFCLKLAVPSSRLYKWPLMSYPCNCLAFQW
jgi:hypothetical protein